MVCAEGTGKVTSQPLCTVSRSHAHRFSVSFYHAQIHVQGLQRLSHIPSLPVSRQQSVPAPLRLQPSLPSVTSVPSITALSAATRLEPPLRLTGHHRAPRNTQSLSMLLNRPRVPPRLLLQGPNPPIALLNYALEVCDVVPGKSEFGVSVPQLCAERGECIRHPLDGVEEIGGAVALEV